MYEHIRDISEEEKKEPQMDVQGEGIATYTAGPNANFPIFFFYI